MAELASPVELIDLQDGESKTFRVLSWEKAPLTIRPPHRPEGKTITAIRVHVPAEDKPTFPHYWDLTATTLVAQMEPQLKRPDLPRLRFTILAQGIGPKKRFSVETVAS